MSEDLKRIRQLLRAARRRWFWHTILRCTSRTALASAVVLLLAWAIARGFHVQSATAVGTGAGVSAIALLAAWIWAMWPLRRRPSDAQVARFVEEHIPHLEDRFVTAVECSRQRSAAGEPFAALLFHDAARAAAEVDLDRTISRRKLAETGSVAAASVLVMGLAAVIVAPVLHEAAAAVRSMAFPARVVLHVSPGHARLVPGSRFRVEARAENATAVPTLWIRDRRGTVEKAMTPVRGTGLFEYRMTVSDDFKYSVAVSSARSNEYSVDVLRAPRVASIDVRYVYPASLGLPPRTEHDGGDIYAPAGTRVRLTVHTDAAVASGALAVNGARRVALAPSGERALEGDLTVDEDGSYRVSLTDGTGLQNPGDTEYFIRVLADAPPDVRITEPGADRQVTPLEEVSIAARAEDDHGVRDFDLVYSVRGETEKAVPFSLSGPRESLEGRRVLYLEELGLKPGDFVTYYARARDAAGSRAKEARSDIYFLQVTPFDQEFVPPETQAASQTQGAGASTSIDDLVRAQKEIVVATWKLDRRARLAGRSAGSQDDVRTVARAQGDLKGRAASAAGNAASGAAAAGADKQAADAREAMARAVEAMGRAEQSLNAVNTAQALPHETRALNELMKAQASRRRSQMIQASAGAGSGSGNSNPDLSSLFDRELRRQQRTSYESPRTSERRDDQKQNDALERLRQLAARQSDLSRRQEELERDRRQMSAEDFKRQLERLTREQSELRQQAEELSQQMKGNSASGGETQGSRRAASGGGRGAQAGARALGDASEAMRQAAARLRDQQLSEAGRRSAEALDKLRSAEQQMRDQAGNREGAAGGDRAAQRASERLGQLRDTRNRLADLERRMKEIERQGQAAAAKDKPGARGTSGQSTAGKAVGTSGSSEADRRSAALAQLREQYKRELQKAADELDRLAREGGAVGLTPEGQQRITSAPGFHQDFSKWEQLAREVDAGFEKADTNLSKKLRDRQSADRLHAPSTDRVPEQYRRLIEQYYQSLVKKGRQ